LIEAFAAVSRMHPDVCLVLTGAKGSMEVRVAKEIAERGIQDRVKRLGYISGRDLDGLYHEAEALVFPSRFEGFGAPVLEAMSRGCPVIAADATAVPEVVGDAGRLVSPDNPDDWSDEMKQVLEDGELRAMLSKLGRRRARELSWSHSANVLEEAYRRALTTTL
jgi:alpha-1,3-rhamnosyl/mannosyltransferase